jgi:hypothetical protein
MPVKPEGAAGATHEGIKVVGQVETPGGVGDAVARPEVTGISVERNPTPDG